MMKPILLIVFLVNSCIVMGLKPRGQGHELVNGRLGQGVGHDLVKHEEQQHNDGVEHKLVLQGRDKYEQQTTPGDDQSTTTSSLNTITNNNPNNPQSPLTPTTTTTTNTRHHKLFGGSNDDDDYSTTNDGKGYNNDNEMSSYQHYYGDRHENIKHQVMMNGEGGWRDQYSGYGANIDGTNSDGTNNGYTNGDNNDNTNDVGNGNQDDDQEDDYHNINKQIHKQNDLDQPNNGQRTYVVDSNDLRQGLREQDTSSVKVRDYVDYNKQITGTGITRNSMVAGHQFIEDDHKQGLIQPLYKGHDGQQSITSQSQSSSLVLHDPNDDQYLVSHGKTAETAATTTPTQSTVPLALTTPSA